MTHLLFTKLFSYMWKNAVTNIYITNRKIIQLLKISKILLMPGYVSYNVH